jgi:hypothetical protein
MRWIAWFLGLGVALSVGGLRALAQEGSQPPAAAAGAGAAHDPGIELLVEAAGAAPAEFASDALLRLSTSSRVTPAWRRELIDEAFVRAYGSQEPYRRTTTQPVSPDTRQGANLLAFSTALSRVSLQVRATRLMTFVDPDRARELFEWIELNPAPATCDDPLVPDVEEYYVALGQIARETYPGDRPGALRFFELYLWRAYLPTEMPSVARAIQSFRRGTIEAAYLEGLFRWLLDAGRGDARGFSSASTDIVSRTADLEAADRRMGINNWYLMEALRDYLVVRLRDARCADSTSESRTPATFNGALGRLGGSLDVKPLPPDVVPTLRRESVRVDQYWQTADSRRLHDAASRLWGPNKAPVSLQIRRTEEWRAQAEQFLSALEPWALAREASDRDLFYQKAVLFTVLMDLVPPGPLRARTIRSYVEFLRHTEGDRDRRLLWFAFVNRLLEASRDANQREILNALTDTHHPVLWLYAQMERTLPQTRQ